MEDDKLPLNFDTEMGSRYGYANHNKVPLNFTVGSEVYLQVFYQVFKERKYFVIKFILERTPESLTLDNFRTLITDDVIDRRLSMIFGDKVQFTEIRVYDRFSIDTGEVGVYGLYGKSMNFSDRPCSFELDTIYPKSKINFKLYGISNFINLWDNPNSNRNFRLNLIPFTSLFTSSIQNVDGTLVIRCIGVHNFTKRSKNFNESTYVLGVRPLGFPKLK